ncbi:MAG: DNA repair protein RadC [Muribaculaceae bacterium]|nr:DNA repair protein RadC [Muribaculaceae bacterium]
MTESSPLAAMDRNMLPREKALANGIKSLTDTELMAIIFSTGIQGKSVLELCSEILADNGGHLSRIASMDCREFMSRYKGIGPAKALTLLAALELGVRAGVDALTISDPEITTSEKAYNYMRSEFYNLDHEQFWILLLNNSNRVIKKVRIGQGGITATVVDVRLVLREAILSKAAAMIVMHNHPSGRLVPSPQDVSLTHKIKEGADIFAIRLLDHLVVNNTTFYSFNDNGKLI